jgi:hypothetical protein
MHTSYLLQRGGKSPLLLGVQPCQRVSIWQRMDAYPWLGRPLRVSFAHLGFRITDTLPKVQPIQC